MLLNPDICYSAIRSKDTRFDGLFFVGVQSTGIYCRPICPARTAGRDQCLYFSSAAAAEKAGFRPCLRCRPELAPGNAPVDMKSRLVEAAVSHIEDDLLQDRSVADLADQLGVTARHLRRVFKGEFGVTPIEYAQTKRLLLAKHLLTDTRLPVIAIAFASGFSSVRRFNALFRERYRLTPTNIRKYGNGYEGNLPVSFELGYRPPLDWEAMTGFLKPRLTPGVEMVRDGRYFRTVHRDGHSGWISAGPVPGKPVLQIEVSPSLIPVIRFVIARAKRMFDLTANPGEIEVHLEGIPVKHSGLRIPGTFDGFELAVRAILGQQITVKAASTLSGRFAARFGELVETPYAVLTSVYPGPVKIANTDIGEIATLGITASRAGTILALARAVTNGEIRLDPGTEVEETMEKLCRIPGIGAWTAQYIALRALGWPDAFPHTDLGIRKALGEDNHRRIGAIAEQWRPWRGYAAMHLWKSLEEQS